jgi:hypothetical protein
LASRWRGRENQDGQQNSERKNQIMKSRNTLFAAFLSALAFFALSPKTQAAPETALPGFNTADGQSALANVTTGSANSAFGAFSLLTDTDGSFNTGLGAGALLSNNASGSTAVGAASLLFNVGSFNTGVGVSAGINNTTGSNNIYVGDGGVDGETGVIAIGGISTTGTDYTATFIGGVFGAEVNAASALPVFVDTDGHLGTTLVADAPGRQGARHQAMLNKSDHRKLQELQATVGRQQKEIAMLTAQLREQAAQIQKVSAQLELKKPAPRTVANKK